MTEKTPETAEEKYLDLWEENLRRIAASGPLPAKPE